MQGANSSKVGHLVRICDAAGAVLWREIRRNTKCKQSLVLILLVCAVFVLHLHTCFSEAQHLNRWQGWQVILMFALTGTLFIYK